MTKTENYGDGERWVVALRYDEPYEMVSRVSAEALNVTVDGEPVEFGTPAFVVVDAKNLGVERGNYDNPAKAAKRAERLNREDLERGLDPPSRDLARQFL